MRIRHSPALLTISKLFICGSRDLLLPSIIVVLQRILDLNLVIPSSNTRFTVQLAKAAENTGANTPLGSLRAAPVVALPAFQGGLDQVAGAVAHAGPEEEDAVLGLGRGARDEGCDGVDDGGLAGAEGDAATPGVLAFVE